MHTAPLRGRPMQTSAEAEHQAPGRVESALFYLKSRVFIVRRWWRELGQPVLKHPKGNRWRDAPVIGEARSDLWTQISPAEFPLTAGKVQNLRAACRRLDGLEIHPGGVFSFWRQIGRATPGKGFAIGRELRSGCMVPNLGGGLCQLSGLLHEAALKAGLTVLERHPHSRALPGRVIEPQRDATVFWNYVDLRFLASFGWRLEARLTATELIVSIRANESLEKTNDSPSPLSSGVPVRATADGDCLTCGVTSCFRHPTATRNHPSSAGHAAWLLDGVWPEFAEWCHRHAKEGDRWFTPLDGARWNRPNYAWRPNVGADIRHETWHTLVRSWRQRRLPTQGAIRQKFLLKAQRDLAEAFARQLSPEARHVVVSQTLLPHLWRAGHLGGRTFDVLANRWPLEELQARLDAAAQRHPGSETLVDFRADEDVVDAEREALQAAARVITPHRAIASHFGARALLLEWNTPSTNGRIEDRSTKPRWFFPASALARKGIHELVAVLDGGNEELWVLGKAREGRGDPLHGKSFRSSSATDWRHCTAVVLPAWVEHEPRVALRALAHGVPVIASRACGLPGHPLLLEIEAGNSDALRAAMDRVLSREVF